MERTVAVSYNPDLKKMWRMAASFICVGRVGGEMFILIPVKQAALRIPVKQVHDVRIGTS